ncbi:hypothetical protein NEHOM01_0351 [Nematocida homosporus]|uniref:uncharacterized protein n=1 Tax=Nematocida homosporus TaxID=1912981 RepID=UPI00221F6EAA|nr:uncharacterized protein NEHOM01_0351 [Nematocida homosporus]KAI5184749.1 hypothetical protein NEHOM01_0351 [Nematocida homosporus]
MDSITDQSNPSGRSWLLRMVDATKLFVKSHRILKYGLYTLGGFLCTGGMTIVYINTMTSQPGDELQGRGDPQDFQEILRNEPVILPSSEISISSLPETVPEAISNYLRDTQQMILNLKETEVDKLAEEYVPERSVAEVMESQSLIIKSIIKPEMSYVDFTKIYKDQIWVKQQCKDILCGRCHLCSWVDDSTVFYEVLREAAEAMPSKEVPLYDSISALGKYIKDTTDVFASIDEEVVRSVTRMMMRDELLYMRLEFHAISDQYFERIPMVCWVFVESTSGCFAHRFRFRNTLIPDLATLEDIIKKLVPYQGYSIPPIMKELAMKICSMQKGERITVEATIKPKNGPDGFYSKDPIAVRREGEVFKYIAAQTEPMNDVYFLLAISKNDELDEALQIIPKYRFVHFISQFGEEKEKIVPGNLLATLETSPLKAAQGVFDWMRKGALTLIRSDVKVKNDGHYDSEQAHALTVASSLCKWEYQAKRPVKMTAAIYNGGLKYLVCTGVKITMLPTKATITSFLQPFRTSMLFSYSGIGTYIARALSCLVQSGVYPELKGVICLEAKEKEANGFIWCRSPQFNLQETYSFTMFDNIASSLGAESKEQWVILLFRSLFFAKEVNTLAVPNTKQESIQLHEFMGIKQPEKDGDKKDDKKEEAVVEETEEEKLAKLDILDLAYTYMDRSDKPKVNYAVLILDTTVFVQFIQETPTERTADMLSLKEKSFSGTMRDKVLESAFVFGTLQARAISGFTTPILVFTKKLPDFNNTCLTIPHYAYTRLYALGRTTISLLERGTTAGFGLKDDGHSYTETFFGWLDSLGRFSTLSLRHRFLYLICDFIPGAKAKVDVFLLKKTVKDKGEETSCEIEFRSGAFREKCTLYYIELPKKLDDKNKIEKPIRKLFAKILELKPNNDKSFITINLDSLRHFQDVDISIKSKDFPDKHEFTVNHTRTLELAKSLNKCTEDISKARLPLTINGNISIPIAILE